MDEQQNRMEERLDDAIHVLRNHAEGSLIPGHDMAAMMAAKAMPPMGPSGYLSASSHSSARDSFRVSILEFFCMAQLLNWRLFK